MRRRAGIRRRESAAGRLAGAEHRDDPLLFVGGGSTELDLDLLFDVELAPPRPIATPPDSEVLPPGTAEAAALERPRDVRELTAPLWRLAENPRSLGTDTHEPPKPPLVRFVWGRAWNVPGVVVAVAERLERFTPDGHPTRSWLRLRLRRAEEPTAELPPEPPPLHTAWPTPDADVPAELIELREPAGPAVTEAADEDDSARVMVRPDLWAQEVYGSPFLWRLYAYFSDLADPLFPDAGATVRFPPRDVLDRPAGEAAP